MVAAIAVWVGAALAGSTLVFQQFVKPRLPVYKLQVESLPRLRWIEEHGTYKTQLPTRVQMTNENYVPIDVHALQFDVFYSGWDGTLQHLGHIQDRHQQKLQSSSLSISSTCTASKQPQSPGNNNSTSAGSVPVWQIGSRSDFDCQDALFFGIPSVTRLLTSVFSLASHWWKSSGRMILPTTGVAHIQIPAVSVTVSLICDNLINTWTMQVEGLECVLKDVQPGWVSLQETAESVRRHAMSNLRAFPETGGVILQSRDNDKQTSNATTRPMPAAWKDLVRSLEREEHIKLM